MLAHAARLRRLGARRWPRRCWPSSSASRWSAALVGVAAATCIAGALLPDVAASPARALRRAGARAASSLGPAWWAAGLGMSLLGALAAGGRSLWRAWRLPLLARGAARRPGSRRERRALRRAARAGRGARRSARCAALAFGRGLPAGFAVIGGLLLAAALALPAALGRLVAAGRARAARGAGGRQWVWADARRRSGGCRWR